ncbi:MAG TPA: S9 family peptidase, partial [Steroidobacteraceae bacterium]|nr:S9 family peptidase [Steroidobacteraceae bacterium]
LSPLCYADALTPAQALSYTRAGELHFSADGKQLVYVASSYLWDALPRIRVVDVATGNNREITPSGKSERAPQWAPDGSLAFLSTRGGKVQVYLLPPGADEPTALTAQKYGVERFRCSPDGTRIAYLAKDDAASAEDSGPQVADRESILPRLWVLDPKSQSKRRLGPDGYRIDEFEWLDAMHLLVVASDRPRLDEFTTGVYRVSVADGRMHLVSQPPQPFDGLAVSPDGRRFAVRATGAGGPLPRDLFVGAVKDGRLAIVSEPAGMASADVRWRDPGTVWLLLNEGFDRRIYRLATGAAPARIDLPLSVAAFDVARDGTLAFVGEDYAHLPQLYLRGRDGAIRQLGELQQGWTGGDLAATQIFRTESADGLSIEAALMIPTAPASGKQPLVLLVHGGPAANFSAGYGWEIAWAQVLASNGYQVLMVNPRGSTGYSEAFVKANRGDWGGGDYRDLMTVLDVVLARGRTDRARLGIGGWSYGGEMSAWAITQTGRFKAAVVGAGVFDQQAEFETENEPQFDAWYFGTPWEQPEVFARNSPATYIRNARTPTLILGGANDSSNPVGQSTGLYRALKHFGVETEMVLYPGEGHSPRRLAYNIDMFERILAWYGQHLQPEPGPP